MNRRRLATAARLSSAWPRLRARYFARHLDAFAQFHPGAPAGNVRDATGHHVAFLMLGDVFVDAGGLKLLHAQADAAALSVHFQDLRAYGLARRAAPLADG